MTKKATLDIGEVIRQTGIKASTLRYYEEKGLIVSIGRKGLRRQYSHHVLEQLAVISLGTQAGFSLEELQGFIEKSSLSIDRQRLLEKAEELDKKIQKLSSIRDGLRHAAECRAPSHLECSKFQRLMKLALKHRSKDAKAPFR